MSEPRLKQSTPDKVDSHLIQAVLKCLEVVSPASILVIAPKLPDDIEKYARSTPECELTHTVFESLEISINPLGRFDFVVVFKTLDDLDSKTAQQLISRLRDMHAVLLWVSVSSAEGSSFSSQDAIAQGMRKVEPKHVASAQPQWYEFNLKFYKPAPQWLNSENWANPHQWDKHRW